MDYLICEMVDSPAGLVPAYVPSLIVEAKARLNLDKYGGLGQLVAEIDTVRTEKGYQDPLRGIVTDGRHWRFVEVDVYKNIVYFTALYDSGEPIDTGWFATPAVWSDARQVWGLLRQFFSKVKSDRQVLPAG